MLNENSDSQSVFRRKTKTQIRKVSSGAIQDTDAKSIFRRKTKTRVWKVSSGAKRRHECVKYVRRKTKTRMRIFQRYISNFTAQFTYITALSKTLKKHWGLLLSKERPGMTCHFPAFKWGVGRGYADWSESLALVIRSHYLFIRKCSTCPSKRPEINRLSKDWSLRAMNKFAKLKTAAVSSIPCRTS